jgi:phosphoglycerate dehydrogenase-like enzyme
MPKVLISSAHLAEVEGPYLDILRAAGFEPEFNKCGHQFTEEELMAALPGIPAVVAGSEPYTPRVFATYPQLKVVARVGVGYDAVDVDAATAAGAVVTFAPGTNQDSVAEQTFSLILGLTRNLVSQNLSTKAGRWERGITLPIRGETIGIAGLGRIGKAVALRAEVFGMKIVAYDPFPDAAFAKAHGITLMPFEELLKVSDFVTLHLPATAESRHLINKRTLALMKPTAFLINTSRGAVVNEVDLLDALKGKRLAGAGLDVFEQEPPGRIPLFEFENVIVTPHAAGTDRKSIADMAASAAQAIVDISQGKWPTEKVVNPAVRERFRW